MKFDKNVTPECQEILLKQLKEYELSFSDMTHEERHLLHMWVRKGNSPYENGDYVYDDGGYPMDFVNTLRFWADMQEYYNSLSEEGQREFRGEGTLIAIPDEENDPFFISEGLLERIEQEVLL